MPLRLRRDPPGNRLIVPLGLRTNILQKTVKSVTTLTITAMKQESEEKDWVKVLYEVILKILTLGFYHIEKHRKN